MRRHGMLMCSLVLFGLGIACQLYSLMVDHREPYMQQLSFMFVAMPSALAIIHHYYHTQDPPQQRSVPTASDRTKTHSMDSMPHEKDTEENTGAAPITSNRAASSTPATRKKPGSLPQNAADVSQQQQQQPRHQRHIRSQSYSSGYDDDPDTQCCLSDESSEPLFGEFK